jgi:lipid-binding SYLF domain-containing protein
VRAADLALRKIMADPKTTIPTQILADAYGIMILPDVVRFRFLGGMGKGHGVLMTRTDEGGWSAPRFVRLRAGSVGFQAGYSKGNNVFVFMTRRYLEFFFGQGQLAVDRWRRHPFRRHAG